MKAASLLSMEEALERLLMVQAVASSAESVDLLEAPGRILAEPVVSTIHVPPQDNSSMDGYAVRLADAALFATGLPVSQRIPAGVVSAPLAAGTAARIFTGAEVPRGADAIIMQEDAVADGDHVKFSVVPESGAWIRPQGFDIKAGETILDAGQWLRTQDVALAASIGIPTVKVRSRLRVATFFTGNELAMPGDVLEPGKIYNSNQYILNGLLRRLPVEHIDLGLVPDTLEDTMAVLKQSAQSGDLVITTGGVSVGEEDHVRPAVQALGHLDLWALAIKPGKPLAFGRVGREDGSQASFIGLPGNPVSSLVTFLMFVRPLLLKLAGATEVLPKRIPMRADFNWSKPDRRREFLRVRRNADGGLDLFPNQNSAVLTSTVWADGLIDNPPQHAIQKGDWVEYLPFGELL